MKRILACALALITVFMFTACNDGNGNTPKDTKKETDWRNTIQYESSFFVNSETRLLYALDTGKITLWDNDGEGNVLQTIEYDTSVPDAIERIEKEDFNGDGNCDIRIIYSESQRGSTYRLWLWNTIAKSYSLCQGYSSLVDPFFDEEKGCIISTEDHGYFGTVTKEFIFNETLGIDEISSTVNDAQITAQKIADETAGGTVSKLEGATTIGNETCLVYAASDEFRELAYIAHSSESDWYIDDGCNGFYRILKSENGSLVLGDYMGDAGTAANIAKNFGEGEISVMRKKAGFVGEVEAHRYSVSVGAAVLFIATDTAHNWYVSEDGIYYRKYSSSKNEYMGEDTFEFTIPQEEPIYGDPIM